MQFACPDLTTARKANWEQPPTRRQRHDLRKNANALGQVQGQTASATIMPRARKNVQVLVSVTGYELLTVYWFVWVSVEKVRSLSLARPGAVKQCMPRRPAYRPMSSTARPATAAATSAGQAGISPASWLNILTRARGSGRPADADNRRCLPNKPMAPYDTPIASRAEGGEVAAPVCGPTARPPGFFGKFRQPVGHGRQRKQLFGAEG